MLARKRCACGGIHIGAHVFLLRDVVGGTRSLFPTPYCCLMFQFGVTVDLLVPFCDLFLSLLSSVPLFAVGDRAPATQKLEHAVEDGECRDKAGISHLWIRRWWLGGRPSCVAFGSRWRELTVR